MSRHGIVHHRELEDAGITKSVRARLIMDGTLQRLDRATEVRRLIDRHDAVLDVCEELQTPEVIALITRVHQERLADPARLAALLNERSRHPHRRLLADMNADAALGVHSALEHNYTIDVERRHELPTPQRQVVVGTCAADVWYEEYKLAIELDGWGYHRNRVRHDRRLDNLRAALGIETRRFGWHDVTDDPCGTARVIATILRARGWTGSLRSCRSCPSAPEPFSGG